jgi:hypothetical protein
MQYGLFGNESKKILLVDLDSKIPNLALMKLSRYYKDLRYEVELLKSGLKYYPHKKVFIVDGFGFDKVFVSLIFSINKNKFKVVNCSNVIVGGSGWALNVKLDQVIDDCVEDYSIYVDNEISYVFITRGCIRKCNFCVVPIKEGFIYKYRNIDDIVKHKKVYFLDNNILSYEFHKDILKELVDKKVRCCFNQGLDIRLVDLENAYLLSKLKYIGEYFFSFDDIKLLDIIIKKLIILKKYIVKDYQLKFFVFVSDLHTTIKDDLFRMNFLKENKCLVYVMRHESCYNSINRDFYIALARYCNQVHIFKSMSFLDFIYKDYKEDKLNNILKIYN